MLSPASRTTSGAMGNPAEDTNRTVPSMVPVGEVSKGLIALARKTAVGKGRENIFAARRRRGRRKLGM